MEKNRGENKYKKIKLVVTIIILSLVLIIIKYIVTGGVILGMLFLTTMGEKIEVYEDIDKYQDYIGNTAEDPFNRRMMDVSVFPEDVKDKNVKEFKTIYYNPWDQQYVSYLTIEYEKDEYEKELERLNQIGIEEYKALYSVCDEPEGYDLVAMNSDRYYGFVYAIVPEKDSRIITYVEIEFCNYFADIDVYEYVPNEYLLNGLNVEMDNPYEEKIMGDL